MQTLSSGVPGTPFLILLLPFALLFFEGKRSPRQFVKALSLDQKNRFKTLARSIALVVLMFAVLFVTANALNFFGWLDSEGVVRVIRGASPEFLLVAVTIGPVGEELFFRGYLQKKIGVVFSSGFFAALHYGYGSVSQVLAAFLVSLLLGWELRRNKDVNTCIFAHAAYNWFTVLLVLYVL